MKQKATLERVLPDTNRAGDYQYSGVVKEIVCRKRKTTNANLAGIEALEGATTIYTTDAIINKFDKLDGNIVLGSDEVVNYAGITIGTVAYT